MGSANRNHSVKTGGVTDVLESIRRIIRSQRVASRASEKQVGLSAAQLFALQRLASGSAPSLNELAERTQTDQSSVSVVISKLVKRGFVIRRRSKHDARRIELALTPAAKRLLLKSLGGSNDRLIDALSALNRKEVTDLASLLNKVVVGAGLEEGSEND